eukprot:Skav219211  [mRNA]  locus=scaffold537:206657:221283:+ [translate_table: standard]
MAPNGTQWHHSTEQWKLRVSVLSGTAIDRPPERPMERPVERPHSGRCLDFSQQLSSSENEFVRVRHGAGSPDWDSPRGGYQPPAYDEPRRDSRDSLSRPREEVGHGELGCALRNRYQVPVTCVEPRPLDLRRVAMRLRWSAETVERAGSLVKSVRCEVCLDQGQTRPTEESDAEVDESGMVKELGGGHTPPLLADVQRLLDTCSVVVALHADQAADATVAYAVEQGKAFAVVPCCVYSEDFPHRRLPNGRAVRTLADLVDYLTILAGDGVQGKAGATGSKGAASGASAGQHLLRNPGIVDKILNAAELKPSDVAFEIGPGTGKERERESDMAQWVAMLHNPSPSDRGTQGIHTPPHLDFKRPCDRQLDRQIDRKLLGRSRPRMAMLRSIANGMGRGPAKRGCKRVIACEIDPRMAAEVRKRCSSTGRTNLEAWAPEVKAQQDLKIIEEIIRR